MNTSNLRRLIWVVSLKGGVGKTTFSRFLVNHLRVIGQPVEAWDADGAVGGLVRLLGIRDSETGEIVNDPATSIGYYDVRRDGADGRHVLLNSLAGGASLVLHDLAGGSLNDLSAIVDEGDGQSLDGLLSAVESQGYRLTLCHLVDSAIESSQSVGTFLDLVGPRADHVAVLNFRECKSLSDFPYWGGYADPATGERRYGRARARLLELGGVEVQMPALQPGTRAKMDGERIAPYSARDAVGLTIAERAQAAKYVRSFETALQPAAHLLGLG